MEKITSIYLFSLTLLLCNKDIYGDSIELEKYSQSKAITRCKEGLIANVDNFTLIARITASMYTLIDRNDIWVLMFLKEDLEIDYMLCQIHFSATCENVDSFRGCYCNGYKNGVFEVLINERAQLRESEALVYMVWPSTLSGEPHNSTTYVTLPVIYQEAQATLFVGKREVDLKNCDVFFGIYNVIEWCVYNLLDRTVTIAFDYGLSTSKTICVRHTFHLRNAKFSFFRVSYEEHRGCQRRKSYTCRWKASKSIVQSINGSTSLLHVSYGWIIIIIMCFQSMIGKLHPTV